MIEFARPEFLYALPAAAIPWLIDLLNRRRFRRVRWAAMDYLLQAAQRRRRRIRLQHLLLLLLRTLAVVLIVLLFARPGLARALPGLGGRGGTIAVVLDDSASMAQRAGAGTVFDRAKAYERSLAERAAAAGARQQVYAPGGDDPEHPSGAAFDMDWLAALGARAGAARYYVLTDLRAADWGADQVAPAARRALTALQRYGPVVLVDVGADPGQNAGITAVRRTGRFAYAGAAAALRLVVRNDGPDALAAAPLSVSAGRRRAARRGRAGRCARRQGGGPARRLPRRAGRPPRPRRAAGRRQLPARRRALLRPRRGRAGRPSSSSRARPAPPST